MADKDPYTYEQWYCEFCDAGFNTEAAAVEHEHNEHTEQARQRHKNA